MSKYAFYLSVSSFPTGRDPLHFRIELFYTFSIIEIHEYLGSQKHLIIMVCKIGCKITEIPLFWEEFKIGLDEAQDSTVSVDGADPLRT